MEKISKGILGVFLFTISVSLTGCGVSRPFVVKQAILKNEIKNIGVLVLGVQGKSSDNLYNVESLLCPYSAKLSASKKQIGVIDDGVNPIPPEVLKDPFNRFQKGVNGAFYKFIAEILSSEGYKTEYLNRNNLMGDFKNRRSLSYVLNSAKIAQPDIDAVFIVGYTAYPALKTEYEVYKRTEYGLFVDTILAIYSVRTQDFGAPLYQSSLFVGSNSLSKDKLKMYRDNNFIKAFIKGTEITFNSRDVYEMLFLELEEKLKLDFHGKERDGIAW